MGHIPFPFQPNKKDKWFLNWISILLWKFQKLTSNPIILFLFWKDILQLKLSGSLTGQVKLDIKPTKLIPFSPFLFFFFFASLFCCMGTLFHINFIVHTCRHTEICGHLYNIPIVHWSAGLAKGWHSLFFSDNRWKGNIIISTTHSSVLSIVYGGTNRWLSANIQFYIEHRYNKRIGHK